MNIKTIFFAVAAIAATSCSAVYKSGQTPDDVYYSPVKPAKEVVRVEKKEEPLTTREQYPDRQIVMSIYDPRWRYFYDDYDAYYDPYRYGYNFGYYYNPYYYPSPVYISGSVFSNPKNTTPRMTNLGSYNYSNMVVIDPKNGATRTIRSTRNYNNSNTDNFIRRIITPSNTNSNTYRPSDNNSRNYAPATNNNNSGYTPSSGSGGSGSSGTPVTRPGRGG